MHYTQTKDAHRVTWQPWHSMLWVLGIQPLTVKLAMAVDPTNCKQSWYADDSTSVGKLTEMKKWWDDLATMDRCTGTLQNLLRPS